jgi:hypothetical protein
MNMTTSIDNIPMKTNRNEITPDDSDDPMVKDILSEFEQELSNQQPVSKEEPKYIINNSPPPPIKSQSTQNKSSSYYNEEFIRKTAIIIIVIALIFSPIIFSSFIEKLPANISGIIDDYNFYIKLILSFIAIYLFFYYNLL